MMTMQIHPVLEGFLALGILLIGGLFLISLAIILFRLSFKAVFTVLAKTGVLFVPLPVGYYFITVDVFENWMKQHHTLWLVILIILSVFAGLIFLGTSINNFVAVKNWFDEHIVIHTRRQERKDIALMEQAEREGRAIRH